MAFGRSSHHQVWSEAMVALPMIRRLLGLEVVERGKVVCFSLQPPADWDTLKVAGGHPLPIYFQFTARCQGRKSQSMGRSAVQPVKATGQGSSGEVSVTCRGIGPATGMEPCRANL